MQINPAAKEKWLEMLKMAGIQTANLLKDRVIGNLDTLVANAFKKETGFTPTQWRQQFGSER